MDKREEMNETVLAACICAAGSVFAGEEVAPALVARFAVDLHRAIDALVDVSEPEDDVTVEVADNGK